MGLSCTALCAVVRFTLLRVLALLPFARDASLRLDFALVIAIFFGCAATIAATTEAPPQRRSRRGRIPKRSRRPELDTVLLCLCKNASPFWVILLLVGDDPGHLRIKLAAPGSPQKALTNGRFRTIADKAGFWLRTFCDAGAMSALPPKADMCGATRHVRFVPEADIGTSMAITRKRAAMVA